MAHHNSPSLCLIILLPVQGKFRLVLDWGKQLAIGKVYWKIKARKVPINAQPKFLVLMLSDNFSLPKNMPAFPSQSSLASMVTALSAMWLPNTFRSLVDNIFTGIFFPYTIIIFFHGGRQHLCDKFFLVRYSPRPMGRRKAQKRAKEMHREQVIIIVRQGYYFFSEKRKIHQHHTFQNQPILLFCRDQLLHATTQMQGAVGNLERMLQDIPNEGLAPACSWYPW